MIPIDQRGIHRTNEEFIAVAENAAMNKVTDIRRAPFLKHGFVRFGPLSHTYRSESEEFAPSVEEIDPTVDRLKGIFQYGLISPMYAKRLNLPFSTNWNDPDTLRSVGLVKDLDLHAAFDLGIVIATRWDRNVKVPIENIFVLLVSTDFYTNEDSRNESELLRKWRAKQKYFKGVAILDESARQQYPARAHTVLWESANPRSIAVSVTKEMLSSYRDKPELAVPVYGYSGALYWPKEMTHEEVQRFTSQQY